MAVETVPWGQRGQLVGNRSTESWRLDVSVMGDRVEGGPHLAGTRKTEF